MARYPRKTIYVRLRPSNAISADEIKRLHAPTGERKQFNVVDKTTIRGRTEVSGIKITYFPRPHPPAIPTNIMEIGTEIVQEHKTTDRIQFSFHYRDVANTFSTDRLP